LTRKQPEELFLVDRIPLIQKGKLACPARFERATYGLEGRYR